MPWIRILALCFGVFISTAVQAAERNWTIDARPVRAELVTVLRTDDAPNGALVGYVHLVATNGTKQRVAIHRLSAADRKYLAGRHARTPFPFRRPTYDKAFGSSWYVSGQKVKATWVVDPALKRSKLAADDEIVLRGADGTEQAVALQDLAYEDQVYVRRVKPKVLTEAAQNALKAIRAELAVEKKAAAAAKLAAAKPAPPPAPVVAVVPEVAPPPPVELPPAAPAPPAPKAAGIADSMTLIVFGGLVAGVLVIGLLLKLLRGRRA